MQIEDGIGEFISMVGDDPEGHESPLVDEIADIIKRNLHIDEQYDVLGCGSYGCAMSIGDDRVLKLTSDPDEVQASHTIVGRKLEHVAEMYGAYFLGDIRVFNHQTRMDHRVGAIVLEEMDEVGFYVAHHLQGIHEKTYREVINDVKDQYEVWPHELEAISRESARQRLKRASEAIIHALDERKNEEHRSIARGVAELYRLGVYVVDVHPGNVGYRIVGTRIVNKIFDLGVSSVPEESAKKVAVLQNPSRVPTVGRSPKHWPITPINRGNPVPVLQ